MDMLTWTLAVAAAVCLAYYGIIVVYTGIGTVSAAIWLLAGGFFAVSAAAVRNIRIGCLCGFPYPW